VRNRQDALRFARTAIDAARADISTNLQLRTIDVRRAIDDTIGERLQRRSAELDALLREHQQAMQADQAEVARAQRAASERLQTITEAEKAAAALGADVARA
jgi:hypothetical protein